MSIRQKLSDIFSSRPEVLSVTPRGAVKTFTQPAFWTTQESFAVMPRSKHDYAREVGHGFGSNVVMSPMQFIARTFPEAKLELIDKKKDEPIFEGQMVKLINRPNDDYAMTDLWAGTIISWVHGNGYWLKIRGQIGNLSRPWWDNIAGEVQQLWYAPHWTMQPRWPRDGSAFISHYDYTVNGVTRAVHPRNVIHFRNGIDPRNPRLGISLVEAIAREIFTDDEAANFSASLCKNVGVPGLVVSPDAFNGVTTMIVDPEAIKQDLMSKTTGDHRGEPFVSSIPMKVEQFGFNPQQMSLTDLRNTAEERVCAALGLPAAIVGFGSGLEQTKVGATMRELKSLAWEGCITPMQNSFAEKLFLSLAPDFLDNPDAHELRWNRSRVGALQEDQTAIVNRCNIAVQGGWMRVDHAQAKSGLEVDDTQKIYLRTFGMIEVPAETIPLPLEPEVIPAEETSKRTKSDREREVLARARSGTATAQQRELIMRYEREQEELSKIFTNELSKFFSDMGKLVEQIARDLLEKSRKANTDIDVTQFLNRLEIDNLQKHLNQIGGAHYLRVAKKVHDSISAVMGVAVDLPDNRARQIVAEGGRRLGLVDLRKQTRERLFRELTTARANGEGAPAIARRLREFVPAGPWSSPKVRSIVIARTETLHAQRTSALEAYRAADNIGEVMVFDDRIGFGDEECAALDGQIVSFEDAEVLAQEEHPNGTRSFAPVISI